MARSFTETEKKEIKEKFIFECERSWAVNGYKKTNIDELCIKVGVSKGAFYLFYKSKELLFCDVLDGIQERLLSLVMETLNETPTKDDIRSVLTLIYLEYEKTNIINQRNSPEFIVFLNRAPKEWKSKSQLVSNNFVLEILFNSNLKLKIEKQKAMGIFNALLAIIINKDIIGYNHFEVFEFLLDSAIDKIYD